jgi:hypothetical protein
MSDAALGERLTRATRLAGRRLAWRGLEANRLREDRATMARTFTYLFGLGATLVLISLLVPHSRRRSPAGRG